MRLREKVVVADVGPVAGAGAGRCAASGGCERRGAAFLRGVLSVGDLSMISRVRETYPAQLIHRLAFLR